MHKAIEPNPMRKTLFAITGISLLMPSLTALNTQKVEAYVCSCPIQSTQRDGYCFLPEHPMMAFTKANCDPNRRQDICPSGTINNNGWCMKNGKVTGPAGGVNSGIWFDDPYTFNPSYGTGKKLEGYRPDPANTVSPQQSPYSRNPLRRQ